MTGDVSAPELTGEDLLTLDDDHFTGENVAIVTGAASGIGRATALGLAANDLTVLAADVDEEGLAGTRAKADELDLPGSVETVAADLTDDAETEAVVEEAASHGTVRYLANVAGMQHVAPIEEFPMDVYDEMHAVMLRAPLLLSKLVVPHIQATDDGVGVVGNMCSVHGHYVTRDKVAYNTVKFGLRGLTQSIAAEGNGSLRAFSVSTGYVKTPLVVDQIADSARERGISEREVVEDVMLGQARTKEMMTPAEVANLFTIGFSKQGKHLNGGDMLWDGGYALTYE